MFSISQIRLHPDPDAYDNQAFYQNIFVGFKKGRGNIRDRNKNPKRYKRALQKLSTVRIVDNSAFSLQPVIREPRIIHIYNKTRRSVGCVGDMALVTKNGAMKRAFIVGQRAPMGVLKARMDTNNVIILDKDGNPEGTRITAPLPAWLRGYDPKKKRPIAMSKIVAIASVFV